MRTVILLAFALMSLNSYAFQIYNLSASLNALNEVPPNASLATGSMTGTYDASTGVASMTITHDVADMIAAHIHYGSPGFNGPVIVPLLFNVQPIVVNIPPEAVANFLSGDTYINIHSTSLPGGEIRGQIIASLVPVPTLGQWSIALLLLFTGIIGVVSYRMKLLRAN